MKILVTGCNGQLGNSLRRELDGDDRIDAEYTDYDTLDITDSEAVSRYLEDGGYDVVVNCAAYTAVDAAENDATRASALNTGAVGNLGQAAAKCGARVIHISTDYVFAGQGYRPYDEKDEPYPQGIYGRTKLEGEALLTSFCPDAIIIRTAWLYSEYGKNFVKTMLRLAADHDTISVVADQIGTPTYAGDLAAAIHSVLLAPEWQSGIYHYTDEGVASWYDFAKAIFELSDVSVNVRPIATDEYPSAAKRPMYSVLSKRKIKQKYGLDIPYWRDSLALCLNNMKQEQ